MLFPYSSVFPKHGFSLSQAILSRLNERDLRGKLGFAFDIKLGIPMSGSAARFIENKLKDLGFEIISGRASIVIPRKDAPKKDQNGKWMHEEYYPLNEGEEERLEDKLEVR